MRAVVPNLLTAARIPLGAAAIIAATDGRLAVAATFITLGAVTDGIDGWAARRLGVSSPFGALFDYFCDYLCFVIAPWVLTRIVLAGHGWPLRDAVLMLPLLTAAVRYAINGRTVSAGAAEIRELPGLGTVFFAFLSVTAVFLDGQRWLDGAWFARAVTTLVVLFSLLMVAPITYPKLTAIRGASPLVIVLLACMPFVATEFLATVTLVVGLLYAGAAPLLARKSRSTASARSRRSLRP